MTERSMPPPAWPASASRGAVVVPPQVGERSLRHQTVLDEETYASGLSRIIQRDFFPDLARLRAQNAYLTALDEGTMDDIEESARRLVQEEARCGVLEEMVRRSEAGEPATPLSMPPSTPRAPETPLYSVASTPRTDAGSTPGAPRSSDVRTSMTIGQYQAMYTTEDNASFAQLMDVARKRKRHQYQWAYDAAQAETEKRQARLTHAHEQAEQGRRLALPARLAIRGPESDAEPPREPPKALPFSARGALMYAPDANTVGPARPSAVPAPSEKPRVLHAHTRMTWATDGSESVPSTPSSSLIDAAVAGSPRIQGYGFVSAASTPSHVDLSEQRLDQLMTWGQLAATPRRLDATPRTERTERTERSVEPPTPSAPAPAPVRPVQTNRSHTARQIEDLSPAARHLLQRTTRTGPQLYKPAGSSTPRSARWTPTPSPVARR
ncbi:hypothetical protein MCAP1_000285 [Malassezia caprae]|uniref:Protein DGCR14 n=1 Tax=Malassezia caprae TaxID=1381934 RepID=A0AAF0E3F5_9BASI|nr:hypothetical protein MCAP1_000285 [Malassezia caprae]